MGESRSAVASAAQTSSGEQDNSLARAQALLAAQAGDLRFDIGGQVHGGAHRVRLASVMQSGLHH